jgi:hypothetical protein
MASTDIKTPSPFHPPDSSTFRAQKEGGSPMATIADDDERLLAQIGYEQVSLFHVTHISP